MTEIRKPGAAAVAILAVLFCCASPATAQAAPPAQLSMTIDDGRTTAAPRDELSYIVTVSNLGSSKVKDLVVTQRIPDGAKVISASEGSKKKAKTVTWRIDVAAGKQAELRTRVAVPETLPAELLRFAVTACASTSQRSAPLICATDSDLLPSGAKAEQQQQELAASAARTWWLLPAAAGGGVVLLTAAVVIVVAARRRSRRHRASTQSETAEPERATVRI